jgi:hypothetical protein
VVFRWNNKERNKIPTKNKGVWIKFAYLFYLASMVIVARGQMGFSLTFTKKGIFKKKQSIFWRLDLKWESRGTPTYTYTVSLPYYFDWFSLEIFLFDAMWSQLPRSCLFWGRVVPVHHTLCCVSLLIWWLGSWPTESSTF